MSLSARPCRRVVLGSTLAAGAVAGLSACGDGSSAAPNNTPRPIPEPSGDPVKVAPLGDLPVGSSVSVTVQAREQTYLLHRRDEKTVLAYTAVCPHAGCQVHTGEADFECPCHGSHFSLEDGHATAGPARDALERFAVLIDDGMILLYP